MAENIYICIKSICVWLLYGLIAKTGFKIILMALDIPMYPFANKEKVISFSVFTVCSISHGGPCFHYNSPLGPVTWVKRWNQRVILRWRVSEFCKAHLILNNAGQKGLPLKCPRAFYSLVFFSFFFASAYVFPFSKNVFFHAIHHTSNTKRYVVP